MFLQESLLRKALGEVGIVPGPKDVSIDHINGRNSVKGLVLPIKYPREYLDRANAIPIDRKYRYTFSGNMAQKGGRREMVKPFEGPHSFIEENNHGRDVTVKFEFNPAYYTLLRSGWFGLCPNQKDWCGPAGTAWTYRMIECAFARTLPIVFRETPYSASFMDGFQFFWDDQPHLFDDYNEKIEKNAAFALEKFFITDREVAFLKEAFS